MKILADKYIPFLDGVFDGFATVEHIAPEDFTSARVCDADALIIRTRTKINRELLDGSNVRLVATATIGFDHIDTAYCAEKGITWVSCPGCNAQAVCDYVAEAIQCCMHSRTRFTDKPVLCLNDTPLTIGVVGVGHVGSLVAEMAHKNGWNVLLNDPPKKIGVSLDEIAEKCDIITFHTPLTRDGEYPTYHLCDDRFLAKCKPDALIINAARGGIVDEKALALSGHPCVIDCWENEPNISHELLYSPQTMLASFHIAGYSLQGKMNASQMCLDALCKYFSLPALTIKKNSVPLQGDSELGWINRITAELKSHPDNFELLRKQYKLR